MVLAIVRPTTNSCNHGLSRTRLPVLLLVLLCRRLQFRRPLCGRVQQVHVPGRIRIPQVTAAPSHFGVASGNLSANVHVACELRRREPSQKQSMRVPELRYSTTAELSSWRLHPSRFPTRHLQMRHLDQPSASRVARQMLLCLRCSQRIACEYSCSGALNDKPSFYNLSTYTTARVPSGLFQ